VKGFLFIKIINKFINTSKQIIKNKPVEYAKIEINNGHDNVQLTKIKEPVENNKSSIFARMKEMITSKMINLNENTVQELEEADLPEFIDKSQKIISEGIGIPRGFYAQIDVDKLDNNTAMYYDQASNTISMDFDILNKSKSTLFCYLRHEIEHQKQIYEIFRTEGLGEEVVKYFVKFQTDEVIKNNNTITPKKIQEINLDFTNRYEKHRQKVIEKMGLIPKDSQQAKIAKENWESSKKYSDDHASYKTAVSARHEKDAYTAGFVGYIEYIVAKWIK